ncbi:MAG: hypothetical protein HOP07_12520 [Bacteriovoracaceae bacterium]|nr:hypothetical protein [Bacteriovoracaceae bacterium]
MGNKEIIPGELSFALEAVWREGEFAQEFNKIREMIKSGESNFMENLNC